MTIHQRKEYAKQRYAAKYEFNKGITLSKILLLQSLLQRELDAHEHFPNIYVLPVNQLVYKKLFELERKGYALSNFRLNVSSDNWSGREAFTFSHTGALCFCGWASDDNMVPFVSAFEKWLDVMEKETTLIS